MTSNKNGNFTLAFAWNGMGYASECIMQYAKGDKDFPLAEYRPMILAAWRIDASSDADNNLWGVCLISSVQILKILFSLPYMVM